jgi:lipopolysaccharide/colanic/teichoic acid biosynthesis glycosyltransferase
MKRVGDLVVACVLIVFTLPLMVIAALSIKLESVGPVLERCYSTRGGRRIEVLKFRTTLHQPQNGQPISRCEHVTRVGWFLRYTRIEDLPQLINLLRGDLTLTGTTGRDRPDFVDWP